MEALRGPENLRSTRRLVIVGEHSGAGDRRFGALRIFRGSLVCARESLTCSGVLVSNTIFQHKIAIFSVYTGCPKNYDTQHIRD